MHDIMIQLTGIQKKKGTLHLGPLDLQIKRGYIGALLGKNGAGKSTLFKMMMGILQPDAGTIHLPTKEHIGYVGGQLDDASPFIFQLANIFAHWYSDWSWDTYQHLLERYEIDDDACFSVCSPGVQKKVEWIFAMAHSPDLLLLDEPSNGVDPVSQMKMIEDLQAYTEDEQKCILFSSHNIEEVSRLADYVYIMDQGQITFQFQKDEVMDRWARVWLQEDLPSSLQNHPNIIEMQTNPTQVVTDDFRKLETIFQAKSLTIYQLQKLSLREILGYLL